MNEHSVLKPSTRLDNAADEIREVIPTAGREPKGSDSAAAGCV
jgi:hypothetical protein